jgi:hypothetical protein
MQLLMVFVEQIEELAHNPSTLGRAMFTQHFYTLNIILTKYRYHIGKLIGFDMGERNR